MSSTETIYLHYRAEYLLFEKLNKNYMTTAAAFDILLYIIQTANKLIALTKTLLTQKEKKV